MSLTVDLQMPISQIENLSQEQAATLFKSVLGARKNLAELSHMLHKTPWKALSDPRMQRVFGLLKQFGGPKKLHKRIPALRNHLVEMLKALHKKLSPQGMVPKVAAQKYGADVGADIEKILRDPNMSLEEKLMMLSSTLAAKMESDIEAKMEEWAKLSSDSKGGNQGGSSGGAALLGSLFQAGAAIAGNAAAPGVGGIIGSQMAGMVTGGAQGSAQDDKNMKSKQLETQIQLLMQRLNRMTTMVSTLMQDDHKTKSGVISNMRV